MAVCPLTVLRVVAEAVYPLELNMRWEFGPFELLCGCPVSPTTILLVGLEWSLVRPPHLEVGNDSEISEYLLEMDMRWEFARFQLNLHSSHLIV